MNMTKRRTVSRGFVYPCASRRVSTFHVPRNSVPSTSHSRAHRKNVASTKRSWSSIAATISLLACGLTTMACSSTDTSKLPRAEAESVTSKPQRATGKDGPRTIASGNVVLNQYTRLTADASQGATSLHVSSVADLSSPLEGPLEPGDLIMVVQMQGATMSTDDGPMYGTVKSLRGAGQYELAEIASVSGNTIDLLAQCGLKNTYQAASHVQVVRVPQYTTLTISKSARVTGTPWDGEVGGVIAVRAQTLSLTGTIDASAIGFRGGRRENDTHPPTMQVTSYRSTSSLDGAEKGESVVGFGSTYDNLGGRYGRGAPANGGGGGNSHNAGGGGGANVTSLSLASWTGQGTMDVSQQPWLQAWALDPAYSANGNSPTTSPGGGRGGYSYSGQNRDALTVPPGSSLWGGNFRRELGGLGGHPLAADPNRFVFLGGGGGAGDANHNVGGGGGRGGGIVVIIADGATGDGTIQADGEQGEDTRPENNDAPGGGGGGGTIVIDALAISSQIVLTAKGGQGGNQHGPVKPTDIEAEGPGGGGGGGLIAIRAGNPLRDATGGANGTTQSGALTEFLPNGATAGGAGMGDATITVAPICAADLDSDGDGIQDQQEVAVGSDPHDRDTDDDGLLDGEEPDWNKDSDNDGTPNVLDPDSDNDSLWDGTEAGKDCSDPDTDPTKNVCTPDADQGATTTDPTNPDTDHGGVPDGVEDENHNGQVDKGERDPRQPADDHPGCTEDSECGAPNSGKVCQRNANDAAFSGFCVIGCRGANGNGCPEGLRCSSNDERIGACVEITDASCPAVDASCPAVDASCPTADASAPDGPACSSEEPSYDIVAYGGSSCSWSGNCPDDRPTPYGHYLLSLLAATIWNWRRRYTKSNGSRCRE